MRSIVRCGLILLLLASMGVPAFGDSGMLATAYRASAPPVIDGRLGDDCWSESQVLGPFWTNMGGVLAKQQTSVRVAYTDSSLYLSFTCLEPETSKLQATYEGLDAPIWRDDCVEIFLDPSGERKSYYHLVINCRGALFDELEKDAGWSSGAEIATQTSSDSWTAEVRIPFSSLGKPPVSGDHWAANFCRGRQVAPSEFSAWSCPYGNFNTIPRFGTLRFADSGPVVQMAQLNSPGLGMNHLQLTVSNSDKGAIKLRLVGGGASESIQKAPSSAIKLNPGETATASLNYALKDVKETAAAIMLIKEGEKAPARFADDSPSVLARWGMDLQLKPEPKLDKLQSLAKRMMASNALPEWAKASLEAPLREADGLQTAFHQAIEKAIADGKTLDSREWQSLQDRCDRLALQFNQMRMLVWHKDPWASLVPNEMPPDSTSLSELSLTACVGEMEPSAFLISNAGPDPLDTRIMLEDLRAADGGPTNIPANRIAIHEVLFRTLRDGRVVADALPLSDQIHRVQVAAGETRQVWLMLDTDELVPGKYSGNLEIRPLDSEVPSKRLRLNITILPIRLPDKMPIAVYNWDYARLADYGEDLAKHRVNRFLIPVNTCFPEFDAQGKITRIDFKEHDRWLGSKGHLGGELVYSFGILRDFQNVLAKRMGWEFMSEPWKAGLRAWVTSLVAHLKSLGYNYKDFSMQIWDEAYGESARKVVHAGPFLREIDPSIRWVMDGGQSAAEVRQMDPFVDIWIPHLPELKNATNGPELLKLYKQIQGAGKPVWCYSCEVNMAGLPINSYYRQRPWWVWNSGLDGVCYWAYNAWKSDSWDDLDGDGGDNGVVYSGDTAPITSKRWEASREGLDDYLYLYLLKRTIAEAEKAKLDTSSAKLLLEKLPGEVLSSGEDGTIVQKARDQLLAELAKLQVSLPKLAQPNPEIRNMGDFMTVSWLSAGNGGGRIFFKTYDDARWQTLPAVGSEGSLRVMLHDLDRYRDYQIIIVNWDELGRMVVSPVIDLPAMERFPVLPG